MNKSEQQVAEKLLGDALQADTFEHQGQLLRNYDTLIRAADLRQASEERAVRAVERNKGS